jgi:quinol monooxygenase YgiN
VEKLMILVHIEVAAKPNLVSFLEIALAEVAATVREQEGCLKYQWLRVPGSPAEFVVYAEFESREAFETYQQGHLVQKVELEMLPLLAEPPRFKHFEAEVISQG